LELVVGEEDVEFLLANELLNLHPVKVVSNTKKIPQTLHKLRKYAVLGALDAVVEITAPEGVLIARGYVLLVAHLQIRDLWNQQH